jgi:hypothetical protein
MHFLDRLREQTKKRKTKEQEPTAIALGEENQNNNLETWAYVHARGALEVEDGWTHDKQRTQQSAKTMSRTTPNAQDEEEG